MPYFSFWIFSALLAQAASPAAKPSPTPQAIDTATIEFLKGQFQSLTTSFNIYVALLSAATAVVVGVALWMFKSTLNEAKQEVDRLVKTEIQRAISQRVERRIDYLEQILEREEVPSLVTVDYVLQNLTGTLPREYRLLNARFSKLKLRRLDSRKLNGDVVVLDLVNYLPQGEALTNQEVEQLLENVVDKLSPETVLAIYVPGQFDAIKNLGKKWSYFTSANFPTQLLGNVVNSAYVAHTLREEE